MDGWTIIYFKFQILRSIDQWHTSKMKICLTPYYSSSWDVSILLYESLNYKYYLKKYFERKNKEENLENSIFWKKQTDHFFHFFFRLRWQTLWRFSTRIKSTGTLYLPDGICFVKILPANGLKSKFERMEHHLFLISNP